MTIRMRKVLTVGALVTILAIGAGVAAADSIGTDQDAFLNDVAKRLNVTPAALKAALKGANDDRIDAAVAAGKITKAQGDAMKARSAQDGGVPFFFGGGHRGGGFGHHGGPASLAAAAKYLGLTEAELLKRATDHLDDRVNGTFGPHGDGDHHGFGRPPLIVPGGGVPDNVAPVPTLLPA